MTAAMLKTDDPAMSNRRARLREWIDTHFGGSHALFIASTNNGEKQMNQGELSALLRNKTFGERRARSLEAIAHMPHRYLEGPPPGQPPHTDSEITPRAETATAPYGNNVKPIAREELQGGWPFSRVSLTRMAGLRSQLGARTYAMAMQDIEETLELVVTKWERRAATPSKSRA